ncbi:hypothetical protein BDU57DRAFT_521021 [Ampelomyces quisqualis]|uniref:EF hand domain-containing protein n=1 Tax=Ampelomyces quisqualis TaxID=50730 RepID=A0A6A5QGG9_AMPQU|nr:hypothetical protein BDU57DRAFT_521021 [Ampelomyces quisqualis]
MPASTPNSISRYRPAILALAGAAAAYATYRIYTISQSPPSDSLHRSNAVRRPNARQRQQASQTERLSALYGDIPAFGDFGCHGVRIPLHPHNLISRSELRSVILQQLPQATPEQIDRDIESVYDVFLDRLLAMVSPNRPPSHMETDAIAMWVAERHGDRILLPATAVERARARYALMLGDTAVPTVDGAESVAATDLSWRSDEDTEGDNIDPDGQTLQRTLYHIAEDRARQEGVIHRGVTCNGCDEKPIRGIRWRCANCADFDLCSNCEATNSHIKTHIFYKVRVPAPYLGITKQEPLYPGKPHMMSSSMHSTLKKRLVAETKMEAEEVDALWDQFTCLAGTEWLADPNNIGWALDRRAFNHAFIPRFNSFIAAPNLVYDRIFAYYDSDKNGLIGFEEWIKGIDGMHTTDGRIKSKIVFDGYDIDGDGFISRKDVLRIFRAFYAIEKEATGNYVAEMTEELSVRNALDTISSGQPLGSAFTPHGLGAIDGRNPRLRDKNLDDFENIESVLQQDKPDVAERSEMLKAANMRSVPEDLPQDEQDRILTDRWARRQFYTDQEEGLDRPDCAEDDTAREDGESTEAGVSNQEASDETNTRPRWSRSSSRVRFQDDVDMETRSNASTSSRPFGERWGGYEIPEPEKDLGRDVLYQITQQGFNELLDPIFADRENDAMDAYATRSERRKLATQLEQLADHLRTKEIHHLRVICKIGIFRWAKCIVDMFCSALNKASTFSTFQNFPAIFQDEDGRSVTLEVAQMRLLRIYYLVQLSLLDSIEVPEGAKYTDMALWNTWLCRNQLHNEVIAVALTFAGRLGWISDMQPTISPGIASARTTSLRRDPTMPQFRPNSSADLLIADPSTNIDASTTIDMSSCAIDRDISSFQPEGGQLKSRPGGPFFACTAFKLANINFSDQETAVQNDVSAPTHSTAPVSSDNIEPTTVQPTTTSSQDPSSEEYNVANWRNYTDNPMIHVLHVDSTSGIEQLRFYMKSITHSSSPYYPEIDQRKPLYRHVRELAMDPSALSHDILLASLETVQQEIQERKGSGLINFDEFDIHMQDVRMRFLESWMEWVSI